VVSDKPRTTRGELHLLLSLPPYLQARLNISLYPHLSFSSRPYFPLPPSLPPSLPPYLPTSKPGQIFASPLVIFTAQARVSPPCITETPFLPPSLSSSLPPYLQARSGICRSPRQFYCSRLYHPSQHQRGGSQRGRGSEEGGVRGRGGDARSAGGREGWRQESEMKWQNCARLHALTFSSSLQACFHSLPSSLLHPPPPSPPPSAWPRRNAQK